MHIPTNGPVPDPGADPAESASAEPAVKRTVRIVQPSPEPAVYTVRLEGMIRVVCERARISAEENVQSEIAAFAQVLPQLRNSYFEHLIPLAEIVCAALTAPDPNLTLAREVRTDLEKQLKSPKILRLIRSGTPPTRVILGLGVLLYCVIPVLGFAPILIGQGQFLGVDSSTLLLVALSGAIGSIVSIMVRIRDFARLQDPDPFLHFFTGLFKPVVGVSFALFVFAVLNAGILPISVEETKQLYFFAAIAFVSGFSERFATDVAARAEKAVGTN